VYTFTCHVQYFEGSFERNDVGNGIVPAITALEQSPACDVVSVGFESGDILVINLRTDIVLFTFKQDGGAVTSFAFRTDAQSTKFPYLASSSMDGRIFLWNLGTKKDSIDIDDDDAVDGSRVKLERKLQFILDEAHMQRVTKLHFLHGEPILISSSGDNSIKVWIFDSPDGKCRLLKSRSGHAGTPTRIRYYGGITNASAAGNADAASCEIVSCGDDSTIRLFNTALESHNMEMSQKVALKKQKLLRRNERLPQCIGYDVCETRERQWGNMVTIHKNHCNAYIWRYKHRSITEQVLRQPNWPTHKSTMSGKDNSKNYSTSVSVSSCGNYCVVGTRGGAIYLYNIQSGLPNGTYPTDGSASNSSFLSQQEIRNREASPANVLAVQRAFLKEGQHGHANSLKRKVPNDDAAVAKTVAAVGEESSAGHTQEVTGLFIDLTNTLLLSCSIDGRVICWNFLTHQLVAQYLLQSPQLRLEGFHDSGLVATIGQDRSVHIFNINLISIAPTSSASKPLLQPIRRYKSIHTREIMDLAFTPDGRRFVTGSLDCTMRVYDIPSGRCLNWLLFDAPVLSLTISSSGEYLCFSQANKVGIFMLLDKSLYETIHIWQEPKVPIHVADCLVRIENEEGDMSIQDVEPSRNGAVTKHSDNSMDKPTSATEAGGDDAHLVTVSSSAAADNVAEGNGDDIENNATSTSQRGMGVVTMTTVPRAFWHTLFNLEAIKERNKPIAAPVAPKAAPFFLPTIHRIGADGGATSSFPTPQEAQALSDKVSTSTGAKSASKTSAKADDEDTEAMNALAAMSAWDDEDGGDDRFEEMRVDGLNDEPGNGEALSRTQSKTATKALVGFPVQPQKTGSRILKKTMAVARYVQ
jgi:U3 small nucleolar RNA-associated protein 21